MLKFLVFIICIVGALALIEAVPRYRQTSGKRYGSAVKRVTTDFEVEEFDTTGGDANPKSGGDFAHGKSGVEENQDGLETVTERRYGYQGGPGVNGGHGSRGVHKPQSDLGDLDDREPQSGRGSQEGLGQDGRRPQGGHGSQGGWGTQEGLGQDGRRPRGGHESQGGYDSVGGYGGRRSSSGRGYPGSRGNQGGIENNYDNNRRIEEDDGESREDSHEYPKQLRPKHLCRGCSIANIGNGVSNENRFFFHDD